MWRTSWRYTALRQTQEGWTAAEPRYPCPKNSCVCLEETTYFFGKLTVKLRFVFWGGVGFSLPPSMQSSIQQS